MQFWQTMWAPIARVFGRQSQGTQLTGPGGYSEPAASLVTAETAMQLSAVWACVRLISQTIASLPVVVYQRNATGRTPDESHWFAQLMAHKPNQYQTRYEFLEYQIANLVLHGNCYAKVYRVSGRPVSLMPMAAQQVETKLIDGKVVHLFAYSGVTEAIAAENVWHVRMNGDWLVGRSPLEFGRNIFGIAQAAESTTNKIYSNGAKRSGVLKMDKLLTKEQREQLREAFNFDTITSGDDRRVLVLEGGMEFTPVSMTPEEIELLASRKYQIDEICRWFGVPAILVNQNEGSTTLGSSTGEIISAFYKLNLRPYLEAIENSVQVHLFGKDESRKYEVELSFEALLRASQKERMEVYRTGITSGVMTPNEARTAEWLPRAEGGDKLYIQGAMVPIEQLSDNDQNVLTTLPVLSGIDPAVSDVQATALNGAQVVSLQEIVSAAASGTIPTETARAIIAAAFPALTTEQVAAIIKPLTGFKPATGANNGN